MSLRIPALRRGNRDRPTRVTPLGLCDSRNQILELESRPEHDEVKVPHLGDGIESGDVLEILVREGDRIEKDQGIVELETDKATVEVPSSHAGRRQEVHVAGRPDGAGRRRAADASRPTVGGRRAGEPPRARKPLRRRQAGRGRPAPARRPSGIGGQACGAAGPAAPATAPPSAPPPTPQPPSRPGPPRRPPPAEPAQTIAAGPGRAAVCPGSRRGPARASKARARAAGSRARTCWKPSGTPTWPPPAGAAEAGRSQPAPASRPTTPGDRSASSG